MKKIFPAFLAAFCILTLGACDLLEKKEPPKPSFLRRVGHLPLIEPDPDDNEWNHVGLSPESRKWCAYVVLYNGYAPEAKKLLHNYRHDFPRGEYAQPKPFYRPGSIFGTLPDVRWDRRSGDKSIKNASGQLPKKPEADLDRAAAVYVPDFKELWEAVHSAREYYANREFIEDDFAAGRTLHKQIETAETALAAAETAFNNALQFQEAAYLAKELDMRTRRGDAAQAAMLRLVVLGRNMLGEYERQIGLSEAGIVHGPKLTDFDLPGFRTAFGELASAVKEVETLMGDPGQCEKEKVNGSEARAVVKSAKRLRLSMTLLIQQVLEDRGSEQGYHTRRYSSQRKVVARYRESYMESLNSYISHVNDLMERTTHDLIAELLVDHEKSRGVEAKQVIFTPLLLAHMPSSDENP